MFPNREWKKTSPAPKSYPPTEEEVNRSVSECLRQVTGKLVCRLADGSTRTGSCFLFSKQFYLLTCAHLVLHAEGDVEVTFSESGATGPLKATIVDVSELFGLAVLRIDGLDGETHDLPYLKAAAEAERGADAFCAGFATDDGAFHFSRGQVTPSGKASEIYVTNVTDPGTCGGPCVGPYIKCLMGVIRDDWGQTRHHTTLIPFHRAVFYVLSLAHLGVPSMEYYSHLAEI